MSKAEPVDEVIRRIREAASARKPGLRVSLRLQSALDEALKTRQPAPERKP